MKSNDSLKVLYVIWGEGVLNTGLFNNQIIGQLKSNLEKDRSLEYTLLYGLPLFSKKFFLDPFAFFRELRDTQAKISGDRLTLMFRLLPVPPSFFYAQQWQVPFFVLFQTGFLRRIIKQSKIDIVHCRSYLSTLVCLKAKEKYSLPVPVVFDTRGIFPEEIVIQGKIKAGSKDYRFWKTIEKWLLDHATYIVNVSHTFSEHIKSLSSNKNIATIHTTVNLAVFQKNDQLRKDTRASLGINEGDRVLTYSGTVGPGEWHDLDYLLNIYSSFRNQFSSSKLLVISPSNHDLINAVASTNYPEFAKEILVVKGNNPKEVNGFLNSADYAVLPLRPIKDEFDRLLGYTMIASKTAEYLAVGLPVIVNKDVGAASKLIQEQQIGVVVDVGDKEGLESGLSEIATIDKHWSGISDKCISVSRNEFSTGENSRKYLAIYESL